VLDVASAKLSDRDFFNRILSLVLRPCQDVDDGRQSSVVSRPCLLFCCCAWYAVLSRSGFLFDLLAL
jgi:hypothetical protein